MDHSRKISRLLRKAQQVHLEKTRRPIWFVEGVFNGEEVPEPPAGIARFRPWIVIHVDADRPANDNGKPIGKLCPLQQLRQRQQRQPD